MIASVSLTLRCGRVRNDSTRQERRRCHSKNWESPRTRPAGDKPAPRGPHPHNAGSQSRPGLRTSGRSEPGYHSPRRPLLTGPQGCGFGRLCGRWALALRCRREQRSCFRLAPRAILQCRGGTDGVSVAFGQRCGAQRAAQRAAPKTLLPSLANLRPTSVVAAILLLDSQKHFQSVAQQ